jgi:hypothetical protein
MDIKSNIEKEVKNYQNPKTLIDFLVQQVIKEPKLID